MKKIILIGLGIILGIFLVSALSFYNSNIELTKDSKIQIESMELNNISKSDCIPISLDHCSYSMKNVNGEEIYNLGKDHLVPIRYCDTFNRTLNDYGELDFSACLNYTDYTENEIMALIDKKSEKWLEEFAKVSIGREDIINTEPTVFGGSITITEEK